MASLEEEYNSIVAQLDAFLACADLASDLARAVTHADLVSAVKCITSPNLEAKIKEIDPNWLGLRERPGVTLERLKAVVTTIRQGIFCGGGHLFYIVIRSKEKEEGSDCVYPTTREDKSFKYTIHDENCYFVDIKDLSGRQYTDNLYSYDGDGNRVTGFPNPFNLTQPRLLEMSKLRDGQSQHKFLPYGLRMYAFIVDDEDRDDVIILKNDRNAIVLTLNFQYAHVPQDTHVHEGRHDVDFLLNALNKFT
jgi:hypothetical protein